jgi:arsenate reductase (thioredoxin)
VKYKVLFLCIGNACRSQMAEGFARAYGSDVMEAQSAGLGPAPGMPIQTIETMKEKNIDVSEHFPKGIDSVDRKDLALIVNMTGQTLPAKMTVPVVDWEVKDPIGKGDKVYQQTRDDVERRVMELIMWLRAERARQAGDQKAASQPADPRGGFDTQRRRFR